MPESAKKKTKAKKVAARKPLRKKAAKKKILKKRLKTGNRPGTKKKKAAKKKVIRKTGGTVSQVELELKAVVIEPGPPPAGIPSVEEPAENEEAIGIVTHYYSHLGVAVVQVNKGSLLVHNVIHIKGHTTDFSQPIDSMEYEHRHVERADAGQSIGIKVKDHVREHDVVFRVK